MKKTIKKIIISILIAIFILPASSSQAFAADNLWFHQDYPEWYVKTFDVSNPTEIFGERYTAAQVNWIFYSIPAHMMTALTLGRPEPWICVFSADLGSCITGAVQVLKEVIERMYNFFSFPIRLITDNETGTQLARDHNFSLYSFLYNNELSGTGYLLRKISKLTSLPEAKAQGFGYTSGGAAVQRLWQATRNISYGLLIIIIIAFALMIMFRVKISPQAVITVQSALPKVVIGLVLITFSYAIAGFLIDLMYVVIGITSSIIKASGLVDSGYSAIDLFKDLTSDRNVLVLSWHYVLMFLLGTIATIFSAGFFGGFLLILFFFVVLIATIFNSFKILWLMIKTYVSIILSIVAAPLQILIGIVSPIGGGFGQWAKNFIANLAVYPTVGVMFFLAFFFAVQATGGSTVGDFLARAAPFQISPRALESTTNWDPPLTWGTNSGRFLWMLASFAIYMMIPKVADIIKSMIEGKPFAYGTAIGEAVAPAVGVGKMGLQYTATESEIRYKSIPQGKAIPEGTARGKKFFDMLRAMGQVK
ncbi:MAG: hypothetical protein CH104c_0684 [Candidatus Woesebacteria bacterium]|nr:MAG: hypothetical protein CH104c_0684 [Candidatus Woesebacteria bacterium]